MDDHETPDSPSEPHPWRVLKFGGTSVATADRWKNIAHIVDRTLADGVRCVLVCSAVSGISNKLEALIETIEAGEPVGPAIDDIRSVHLKLIRELDFKEAPAGFLHFFAQLEKLARRLPLGETVAPVDRARIMSSGELMSTSIGAEWLSSYGADAAWLDVRQWLRSRPSPNTAPARAYLSAVCDADYDPAFRGALNDSGTEIVVTQGFMARNADGETVLLGRGGSDTSAAYIGARIGADRVEIWSDVPGVFTANPKISSSARLVRKLGCLEAEAIGAMGGKVLHPRALAPIRQSGLALRLGWTRRPETEGTLISDRTPGHRGGVKAVSARTGLCLFVLERPSSWQPVGFMAEVATCFQNHGLSMDLMASSPSEIRVTVDLNAFPSAEDRFDALMLDLDAVCRPTLIRDVAAVSLVGSEIRGEILSICESFQSLHGHELHLVTQAANDTSWSVVVDAGPADDLVRELHEILFPEEFSEDEVFGETWDELNELATKVERPSSTPTPSRRMERAEPEAARA